MNIWDHFSKQTLLLILVLLAITGGLVYLAIRQEQPTVVSITATPTPSPAHTVLSLVPVVSSTSAAKAIAIMVDSKSNQLTGAQINLAFDPKVLTNVRIKPGTYFTNPNILLNTVDQTNGRISYVIAIQPTGQQASGSGTIATISYTIVATPQTTTKISFLPKTEVTQQGILGSVLKSTTDLTIVIPQALQLSPIPTVSTTQ